MLQDLKDRDKHVVAAKKELKRLQVLLQQQAWPLGQLVPTMRSAEAARPHPSLALRLRAGGSRHCAGLWPG